MSKCELFLNKKTEFFEKAMETEDVNLRKFYFSASKGFELKAYALTLEEAAA